MNALLDKVNSPDDLKMLSIDELRLLSREIRDVLIDTVSKNGGHLASSLGAVELTIALHRVFDSPRDKIIWDVGHQSYGHKVLTGRREAFSTLRQYSGISGFPDPMENEHDAFVGGHAGTSVSAALGMALGRDLDRDSGHLIAVIGDGSLGSGIALEAINHAGHSGARMTVVLNDNGMSISPTVGSIYRLLNRLRLSPRYESAKSKMKKAISGTPLGQGTWSVSRGLKKIVRQLVLHDTFWDDLGFVYLGPIDGHDIDELIAAFRRVRDHETGPALVHVVTRKGKGHPPAEMDAVGYHGVSPLKKNISEIPSYTEVFTRTMLRIMAENPRVVAITAAMLDGTGLSEVAARYPDRVFDVGICEQHAVTMAAGLASRGFVPVVAIYSTFLQRSFDQIIHDVCMQELPVVFAIDRAGIVGDDGKTHQGAFDITFMRCLPNMVVSAPRDEGELQDLLHTAVSAGRPMSIRFPRGSGVGVEVKNEQVKLEIGGAEVLRFGEDIAIVAIGSAVHPSLIAAQILEEQGIECAVINARFAKPLDTGLIAKVAARTGRVVTVEENVMAGGFGSAILELFGTEPGGARVECICLPDRFIEHGKQEQIRSLYNLDPEGICSSIRDLFPELFNGLYIGKVENIGR